MVLLQEEAEPELVGWRCWKCSKIYKLDEQCDKCYRKLEDFTGDNFEEVMVYEKKGQQKVEHQVGKKVEQKKEEFVESPL